MTPEQQEEKAEAVPSFEPDTMPELHSKGELENPLEKIEFGDIIPELSSSDSLTEEFQPKIPPLSDEKFQEEQNSPFDSELLAQEETPFPEEVPEQPLPPLASELSFEEMPEKQREELEKEEKELLPQVSTIGTTEIHEQYNSLEKEFDKVNEEDQNNKQEQSYQEEPSKTESEAHFEMETEPESGLTALMQKYEELLTLSRAITKLARKINKTEENEFEIIGNNTEKNLTTYLIREESENDFPVLKLIKHEKESSQEGEEEHELVFTTLEVKKNLVVKVDGVQLYEEEKELQDPMKAMQVSDKFNKFIFLCTQKQEQLQEEREILKAEKEKMRAFRDIFRNF